MSNVAGECAIPEGDQGASAGAPPEYRPDDNTTRPGDFAGRTWAFVEYRGAAANPTR
ncbi:MAG: hypothetical protein ACK49E_05450 [Planctomyces sp.]